MRAMVLWLTLLGLWTLSAICQLWGASVREVRLSRVDELKVPEMDIPISGTTVATHKQDLTAYLEQKFPGFSSADEVCAALLWFYSRWVHTKLSSKYYNIGVEHFNLCQDLSAALTKTR